MADGSLIFDTKINKSGFNSGINKIFNSGANKTIGRFGDKATQTFNKVTNVGIAGFVGLGAQAMALGTKFDTSFAKASTLFGDVAVDTDNLKNKVFELSKSYGVATTEINEGLYQAMSASVPVTKDMGDVLYSVEQAIKLAKGGFTDTATAMDVLTTATNAYGYKVKDMNIISDMLVKTQNDGKTTVNELAHSLGKAIPDAAGLGIDMANLSTVLAQTTKNGVITAESITGMKGLMAELSDEGSDVAITLKEKTGKSLSQLTKKGKSVGDILEILYNSAGKNDEKFMNLFGNMRARSTALNVVQKGAKGFNEELERIRNSTGTTDSAVDKMGQTTGAKLNKIANNYKVGVTKIFTENNEGINIFLDIILGLANHLDTLIPVIFGICTALTVMKSVVFLVGTVTQFATAVQKTFNFILGLSPMTLIAIAIIAVISALALFISHNEKAKEIFFKVWCKITGFFSGLNKKIPEWIRKAMFKAIEKLQSFKSKMEKKGKEIIIGLKNGIVNGFTKVISFVGSIPGKIIGKFKTLTGKMKETGKNIILGLWKGIKHQFEQSLLGKTMGLVGKLIKKINKKAGVHSPSIYTTYTGEMLAEGINVGWERNDPFKRIGKSVTANEWGRKLNGTSNNNVSNVTNNNQTVNFYEPVGSPLDTARKLRQQNKFGLKGAR